MLLADLHTHWCQYTLLFSFLFLFIFGMSSFYRCGFDPVNDGKEMVRKEYFRFLKDKDSPPIRTLEKNTMIELHDVWWTPYARKVHSRSKICLLLIRSTRSKILRVVSICTTFLLYILRFHFLVSRWIRWNKILRMIFTKCRLFLTFLSS